MPSLISESSKQSDAPVCWLLGLPFDLLDVDTAMARIGEAAQDRRRLIFATPNVDFLARADHDAEFQAEILECDLSLGDGMPLVWLGRLLGAPVPERVAGSTLVERLLVPAPGPKLKVFFFGGPEGAAEAACAALDRSGGRLAAGGALQPGFGDVESMSQSAIIDSINASGSDFLIVALGAEKGHRWIVRNAGRLEVPVISHLGAVVNFLAGRVRRAPVAMQRLGLEWLWRIFQEPALIGRYAGNAWFLLRRLTASVLPLLARRLLKGASGSQDLVVRSGGDRQRLVIEGDLVADALPALEAEVGSALTRSDGVVVIDLSAVNDLDCLALGYLYTLRYRAPGRGRVRIVNRGSRAARLIRLHRAEILVGDTGIEPVTSAV